MEILFKHKLIKLWFIMTINQIYYYKLLLAIYDLGTYTNCLQPFNLIICTLYII